MARFSKAAAAATGLVLAALMLSGCAALRELAAQAPVSVPQPSASAAAEPLEKVYTGGSRPDGLSDQEWQKKAQRRISAAAAIDRILVYSVSADGTTDNLTVVVKGDPADAQLLADIERRVIPVALRWAPQVTLRVDPSVCGVVSEFKDSKICDKLASR